LTATPEIALPSARNDHELFERLVEHGYKIVNFPGCTTNYEDYVDWHADRSTDASHHAACEGFGVTFRLKSPHSDIVKELEAFLAGADFNQALAEKFGVDIQKTTRDNGIQKYLDGYEISPHPDVRNKALTYMVNINPSTDSESADHHTHYLRLRPEFDFVSAFWKRNPNVERCWLPWQWCETVSVQSANNSFVAFAPGCETFHGVRARYRHLESQRTQLYGNLWWPNSDCLVHIEWDELLRLHDKPLAAAARIAPYKLKAMIPSSIRARLRRSLRTPDKTPVDQNVVQDRRNDK